MARRKGKLMDQHTLTILIVVVLAIGVGLWVIATNAYRAISRSGRRAYLAAYRIPDAVLKRFCSKRPALSPAQQLLVVGGLRQYFQICQRANGRFVSMPSQVVDDLWHEFILFTRNYGLFCQEAFGRYLHHTPLEAMPGPTQATAGIRRTWFHACRIENINPKSPERLPLLFALDAQLGISDGFLYALNCENTPITGGNTFCASHLGLGNAGLGCGGGASSCGSAGGDGGCSCGGGGCGGGCGGS